MYNWFGVDATGIEFSFLSFMHLTALTIITLLLILLYSGRKYLRGNQRMRAIVRYGLVVVLALSEIFLQIWNISNDQWNWADSLPLQLCSLSLVLSIILLLTRSYAIYEVVFFIGIVGALQAVLTPALDYSFPHLRFFHFFIAHFAIIAASLYMTWVEGYRPTFRSVIKTMAALQLLLPFIIAVNYWTGGNYMFLARKPITVSLLDMLGPWPWYLFMLEGIAFGLFLFLYLPFKCGGNRTNFRHMNQ
mgnify:CR=1 FL=1